MHTRKLLWKLLKTAVDTGKLTYSNQPPCLS